MLFDETQSHVVNVNEDPILNRKMKYPLGREEILVERNEAKPVNDIVLAEVGVFHRSSNKTIRTLSRKTSSASLSTLLWKSNRAKFLNTRRIPMCNAI